MAISSFALAIVLYLSLGFEEGSPNLSFAAPAAEGIEVGKSFIFCLEEVIRVFNELFLYRLPMEVLLN